MSDSSTGPEHSDGNPDEPFPQPLEDEIAASRPRHGGRLDPATFEVRLRRWALLLLVAVPTVWFLVEQLR